jgi:hypothetical protein
MSIADAIGRFFEFFSVIMLAAAFMIAALMAGGGRGGFWEHLFRWTSLLAAGVVGVFTFYTHVFMAERSAQQIGWPTSPFQFEVGIADLVQGVLGVLAFRASHGFRRATTVAVAVWLWGDAIGHVRQMIVADNFAPGNAGPWFWSDVLVPAVMIVSLSLAERTSPPPLRFGNTRRAT